jgi:1-acyl-sn-glycerol-3-phosphate acyltransferase
MLYIFRLIITVIYSILVCVFGSIYCLFSPRNPKHVATFGHMFGRLAPLFGLKVECRKPTDAESYGNAIYIANHQNNYDMVTGSDGSMSCSLIAFASSRSCNGERRSSP